VRRGYFFLSLAELPHLHERIEQVWQDGVRVV